MYREFDLSVAAREADQLLNNPTLRLVSIDIFCSAETAYTRASLRFIPCEPRKRKFIRKLRRFVLFEGANPQLDERLSNENVRLIKQYVFPTSEGTVVVLDYQIRI